MIMIYDNLFLLFFYVMILFLLPSPSCTETLSSAKPIAAPAVAIDWGR